MSTKVSTEVRNRLNVSGNELLVALEIADVVGHDGRWFFKSLDTIARLTRQSKRTVRRQLAMFREVGWLIAVSGQRGGRHVVTRYRISEDWIRGVSLPGLPDGWFGDPETNPVSLSAFQEKGGQAVFERRTPEVQKADTAVSGDPVLTVNNKSDRPRAIPSGSRSARQFKTQSKEIRIAAAREMLAKLPDYPLEVLRKIYGLEEVDLALVTAPAAVYSAEPAA